MWAMWVGYGRHVSFDWQCAETHERFYIIEVHRHRFEMSARKVPFEKCTRWRKVCGRSAKDQIGDSIYSFFFRFRAKGLRKARERCAKDVSTRAMSCPKWAAFSHAWFWSKGKRSNISQWHFGCFHSFVQTTTDLLYSLYSSLFDSIYLIPDTNSWFWKMQPLWDRERRRKIRERFAKGGFLGTFIEHNPHIYRYIMKLTNMYIYSTTHYYKYTQYLLPFGVIYASIPPPNSDSRVEV